MKSYNEEIAELEVVRALLFERIKNGLSKKIARFYNEMIDDLQAQILKDKNIATHLKDTIAELKSRLSTPDLHKDFAAIARSELEHLDNYNKILGFALFARVLPEKSIENLISTTLVQGATIKAWNYGLQADQAKRLERDLKIGISLGETNALLAQRIAASLGKSKREATTLAVTGAGAIVSEVRQKFFEANDDVIKYYQYQATLDTRTSELCRAYDGLLWDTEYKPVDHKLPFRMPRVNTHFNCRSTIIPITKSWEELGVEGMKEIDAGTRASMNGYVPKNMNFNDWLKTQPSETIEKTLGKGRAELFLQGKITMRDLITQQGRSLDLDELYKNTASQIRLKAANTIQQMFKGINLSEPGYRPPLKHPIELTVISSESVKFLQKYGIKTQGILLAADQKSLLHGLRTKKIKHGNALTPEQFFKLPLSLTEDNLFLGEDEKNRKIIKFYWDGGKKTINYAYFRNDNMVTYGTTNKDYFEGQIKSKKLIKVKGDGS